MTFSFILRSTFPLQSGSVKFPYYLKWFLINILKRAFHTVIILCVILNVISGSILFGHEINVRQSQLFLDDSVIESSSLIERILHQPIRHHANPLYGPEKLWEGPAMNYLAGVYKDEKMNLFRAWYVGVVNGKVAGMPKVFYPICTIHSKDGIHWKRPKLESYSHLTGGSNNIVFHLGHGCIAAPNIIHDPVDKDAPWKLIIHHSPSTPCHYYVRLATSQDGFNWKWKTFTEDKIYARLHDRMTVMHDPSNQDFPYLLFGRSSNSKDYPLLYSNRIKVREVFKTRLSRDGTKISNKTVPALRPDIEDPPYTEFYHMSAFRYESLNIGLLMIYRAEEPPHAEVQLTTNRPSEKWRRVRPRKPFIPSLFPTGRNHGIWDAAGVQPALSPPVLHNGSLYFYYYGGPAFHGSRFLKGQYQLGVAQLRPDGFASLRATWREGMVTTKPFEWTGGKLKINAQSLGGNRTGDAWVKVEILNENGLPVPQYSKDYSDPLEGDLLSGIPIWSGKKQNLDSLIGKKIRLRFHLKQTEIFSFQSIE